MKRSHWTSLRTRITLSTMVIVVLTLWLTTLLSGHVLRSEMEAAISTQQFSAVALAAKKVDQLLSERIAAIEELAAHLSHSKAPLDQQQLFLEDLMVLPKMFNWGIMILDSQGIAQASLPSHLNRASMNYYHMPSIQGALKHGQTTVSDPMIDSLTQQPMVFVIAPIRDKTEQIHGLAIGVINLANPNILDTVNAAKYGLTGDFFIIAPNSRRYVASSDKRRIMLQGPPIGVNPLYDRHLEGYEGSGQAVSSRGVMELASAKLIPSVGWMMASVLPADEAFAPIDHMQHSLLVGALMLTMFASVVSWWWLRRQFGPVSEASDLLNRMGDGSLPRQSLPVHHNDEIGQLSNAFNTLLERIIEEEERAAEYAANELLSKIVSHVPGVVFQYQLFPDGHGSFSYASPAFNEIFGVSPEMVRESTEIIRSMVHPDDKDRYFASLHASAVSLTQWRLEYRIYHPGGGIKWLLVEAMPERNNENITWYGFIADITEAKETEESLRIAATTFQTHEGILIIDANRVIIRVNPAFSEMTGYTSKELIGHTPEVLESAQHGESMFKKIDLAVQTDGLWQGETIYQRKNGDSFPAWMTVTAVKDKNDEITHFVSMVQDVTARKEAEEKIRSLAFYDPLTNLPNRRLLLDRLQQAIAVTNRNGRYGALLCLDIDNFKMLNDSRGHHIGDRLLIEVAARLQSCVREGDSAARLGGDEFVLLIQDMSEADAAEKAEVITRKVLLKLSQPYQLDGKQYKSTSSFGVALFSGSKVGVDELLMRADLAMYQAKSAGRNTLRFFDPSMQAKIEHRSMMEGELHRAYEEQEFILHYQPQIDHESHCIGVEALIRWQHPDRGFMPPDEFIPLAEECDLIQPIGQWVIEEACERLAEWANNKLTADLTIAVNISAKQFRQESFIEQVSKSIRHFDIDPKRLKLELTESLLLVDIDDAIAKMLALRGLGLSFSLDDFGTGYSSLSYLKRLPLDQIKIDRSFVDEIMTDPNDSAICRAIIALGKSLDLQVIAEGVESEIHWEWLCEEGCDAVQGYFFSRPVSEPDLLEWLHQHSLSQVV